MPSRTARAGGAGAISWDRNLGDNLRAGNGVFLEALSLEFEMIAQSMESFAKQRHPWTNRTGDAERTFSVRVVEGFTIVAQHGVPYGKWLEFRFGGKYGVIPATLEHGRGQIGRAVAVAWMAAWRFP